MTFGHLLKRKGQELMKAKVLHCNMQLHDAQHIKTPNKNVLILTLDKRRVEIHFPIKRKGK